MAYAWGMEDAHRRWTRARWVHSGAAICVVTAGIAVGLAPPGQAAEPRPGRFEGSTSHRFQVTSGQRVPIRFRVPRSRGGTRRIVKISTVSGCHEYTDINGFSHSYNTPVKLAKARVSASGRIAGSGRGRFEPEPEKPGVPDGQDAFGTFETYFEWSIKISGRFTSATRAKGRLVITTTTYSVYHATGQRVPARPGTATCTQRPTWRAKRK